MTFIFSSVNLKLNLTNGSDLGECLIVQKSINEMSQMISRVKVIHFKLWLISNQISNRFQWFLLCYFSDFVLITIRAAMGIAIYLIIFEDDQKYIISRNYEFFDVY